MSVATLLPAACAGFLLAVLWMDLIFDVQVVAHRRSLGHLPEPVLASIAGYYRRATTRPMSMLIGVVMLMLLAALAVRGTSGDPGWLIATWAALAGGPILLALIRTVPNAVRLGQRADTVADQSRLARAIFRDHVVCFALMLAFLGLWLAAASLGL